MTERYFHRLKLRHYKFHRKLVITWFMTVLRLRVFHRHRLIPPMERSVFHLVTRC